MSTVLIVDDEASICWAFREFLTDEGHAVEVAATAEEGLAIAGRGPLDLVVLDVRLPGLDGLSAMARFRDRIGPAPIVVITAFGSLETAVRAIENGAFDYLVKPFDLDRAAAVVRRALESHAAPATPPPPGPAVEEAMIGTSPVMQELFKRIALVAATDVPVLITGESGTGKELVARAIHRHSRRSAGPFLPICLAALSASLIERELFGHVRGSFTGAVEDRAGLLELARGGTVLLDEIGDVPPDLQVKLLRALEQGEVTPVGDARPRPTDLRVVAATNRPLNALMAAGTFREDLFFRLSVFPIHVPPLRERGDDVQRLADHFLARCRSSADGSPGFTPEARAALGDRPWAGNVRELRNAVEHAAIVGRGRPIEPEHLPPSRPTSAPAGADPPADLAGRLADWTRAEAAKPATEPPLYDRFLELAEPPLLRAALAHCGGNRAAAAQLLGIHRATLRQKLRRHGLE